MVLLNCIVCNTNRYAGKTNFYDPSTFQCLDMHPQLSCKAPRDNYLAVPHSMRKNFDTATLLDARTCFERLLGKFVQGKSVLGKPHTYATLASGLQDLTAQQLFHRVDDFYKSVSHFYTLDDWQEARPTWVDADKAATVGPGTIVQFIQSIDLAVNWQRVEELRLEHVDSLQSSCIVVATHAVTVQAGLDLSQRVGGQAMPPPARKTQAPAVLAAPAQAAAGSAKKAPGASKRLGQFKPPPTKTLCVASLNCTDTDMSSDGYSSADTRKRALPPAASKKNFNQKLNQSKAEALAAQAVIEAQQEVILAQKKLEHVMQEYNNILQLRLLRQAAGDD